MLDTGDALMPRSSLLFFICKMKRSPQSQFVFVIRHQFNFFRSNIWRAMRIDEEEFFAVISFAVYEGDEEATGI